MRFGLSYLTLDLVQILSNSSFSCIGGLPSIQVFPIKAISPNVQVDKVPSHGVQYIFFCIFAIRKL
jgi:hypothetical protein